MVCFFICFFFASLCKCSRLNNRQNAWTLIAPSDLGLYLPTEMNNSRNDDSRAESKSHLFFSLFFGRRENRWSLKPLSKNHWGSLFPHKRKQLQAATNTVFENPTVNSTQRLTRCFVSALLWSGITQRTVMDLQREGKHGANAPPGTRLTVGFQPCMGRETNDNINTCHSRDQWFKQQKWKISPTPTPHTRPSRFGIGVWRSLRT